MMKNQKIIIVLTILISFGAGFIMGIKYQQSKTPTFSGRSPNNQFANRNGQQNRGGFRPVSGEIISVDDNSLTVRLSDGTSKIIILSEKTSINQAESKSKNDIITGTKVAVFGTENSDGTITAQNIQINPIQINVTPKIEN